MMYHEQIMFNENSSGITCNFCKLSVNKAKVYQIPILIQICYFIN